MELKKVEWIRENGLIAKETYSDGSIKKVPINNGILNYIWGL